MDHFSQTKENLPNRTRSYGSVNAVDIRNGAVVTSDLEVALQVSKSAPALPLLSGGSRYEEYNRRYQQLSNNVAYRYPNPGPPRERQGRIGGTWRHIKEVLGQGGSRVVFVDGLVSLYDHEKALSGSKYLRDRLGGPAYAPTGSQYQQMLQRDLGSWSKPPSAPVSKPPTLGDLPAAPIPPPSPQTTRYRGFYRYK